MHFFNSSSGLPRLLAVGSAMSPRAICTIFRLTEAMISSSARVCQGDLPSPTAF
jgi:hypothetical protein